MTKPKNTRGAALPVIHPNAAGIDVGSMQMDVAVPADRAEEPVRQFGSFTSDLQALARWLRDCGVDTVAMEATGVYWKNLCTILIQEGFEVCLANSRHTKNVSGRKSDEGDAQWIQRLHACGLLSSGFLPDDLTCRLRNLMRHRRSLVQDSTRYQLRMQKALEEMNIKVHSVLRDLTGKSGTAIVEAIVAGERDAAKLVALVDWRVKASREVLLRSLEGNWRAEQLFLLEQNCRLHRYCEEQIRLCDDHIETALQMLEAATPGDGVLKEAPFLHPKAQSKKHPRFDTRSYLQKIHGVDVMDIYGISATAALEILSETGADLSKWPAPQKFVSWLNLCPNNKFSGGKLISSSVLKKKPNAAAQAFKYAANGLQRSDHWLGDYFRRMKAKGGNKYAIVATASKLAIIYYNMVRYKQPFTPFDNQEYKAKYQKAKIAYLERALARLKQSVA